MSMRTLLPMSVRDATAVRTPMGKGEFNHEFTRMKGCIFSEYEQAEPGQKD